MKTHLDLFSGIGGFALAASWAGYQTVGFCEIEDYPRRILSKRFAGVPIHRDVRELDGEQYRGVSLITGGYPCQPFSHAGKRKGTEDDRHLWPEMFRIIAQARPAWVLAENVAGHITMGLDEVLADLESEGYSGRTLVVPACAKNALHRRDRCWIIARNVEHTNCERWGETREPKGRSRASRSSTAMAHSGSGRGQGGELQAGQNKPRLCGTDVGNANSSGMERPRSEQQAARSSRAGKDVADTDVARLEGLPGSEGSRQNRQQQITNGSLPRRTENYWQTEPAVGRVADGLPNRVDRLKGLGNAIVPQVAYEIIRELGA